MLDYVSTRNSKNATDQDNPRGSPSPVSKYQEADESTIDPNDLSSTFAHADDTDKIEAAGSGAYGTMQNKYITT